MKQSNRRAGDIVAKLRDRSAAASGPSATASGIPDDPSGRPVGFTDKNAGTPPGSPPPNTTSTNPPL